jgi:hypothetical protein
MRLLLLAVITLGLLPFAVHLAFSLHHLLVALDLALPFKQLSVSVAGFVLFPVTSKSRLRRGVWHGLANTGERVAGTDGLLLVRAISLWLLVRRRRLGDIGQGW